MFDKKLKLEINDNFNMIMNFILSANDPLSFKELLQYCLDYDLYREFYVNLSVFRILLDEKNLALREKKNLDNQKNNSEINF